MKEHVTYLFNTTLAKQQWWIHLDGDQYKVLMNLSPPETSRKTEMKLRVTDLFEVATLHRSVCLAPVGNKSVRHSELSTDCLDEIQKAEVVSRCCSSTGVCLGTQVCDVCWWSTVVYTHSPNHFLLSLFALRFPSRPAPPRPTLAASPQWAESVWS